jgi:hypothetical protein
MPGEPQIVAEIADLLREMDDFGPPQLLLRVYPKDRTGRFEELLRTRPDIISPRVPWEPAWLTPKPDDAYLLTNSLLHCEVGLNVASTISLELCMFDKPVINIAYNPPGAEGVLVDYERYYDYDHYRPVAQSGAVALAKSRGELRSMLRNALADPSIARSAREAVIGNMFGSTLDGHSHRRVANTLVNLAAQQSGMSVQGRKDPHLAY